MNKTDNLIILGYVPNLLVNFKCKFIIASVDTQTYAYIPGNRNSVTFSGHCQW